MEVAETVSGVRLQDLEIPGLRIERYTTEANPIREPIATGSIWLP